MDQNEMSSGSGIEPSHEDQQERNGYDVATPTTEKNGRDKGIGQGRLGAYKYGE